MAPRQQRALAEELRDKPTPELVGVIAKDVGTLVRKEMELGREELAEAVVARVVALGAIVAAAVVGLLALVFFGLAAAAGLAGVVPDWAGLLIVAGVLLVGSGGALAVGRMRSRRPPFAPEETARTVKEDIGWAKEQLKR
jgi:hypothetical protein